MISAFIAFLSVAQLSAGDAAIPRIEQHTFDQWKRHILPTADELLFETIPWRPSFAEGLRDAAAADKPLLLWVMNGHPLGCT